MDHAGEGRLLAYLDGELTTADEAVVRGHLLTCAACSEELGALKEASARLTASLRLLDAAAPEATSPAAVLARARSERVTAVRRTLLRAAGIVLVLAGGGAAALPGSPVRDWVRAAWDRGVALIGGTAEPAAEPATAGSAEAPVGIDAAPVGGRIEVALLDLAPGTEVRVRLVDSRVAWVEASELADGRPVRFARGPGRVEVSGGGTGVLRVDVPRDVPVASIEVDGRLRVVKEGKTLRAAESEAGSGGEEVSFKIER